MKRIINVLLVAVVLSLIPMSYASAQWHFHEGLAKVMDANGKMPQGVAPDIVAV